MHAPAHPHPQATREPDPHAALILGLVLGLILAGLAAVGVGGWQLWSTQVNEVPDRVVMPSVTLPIYSAEPSTPVAGAPASEPGQEVYGRNPYVGYEPAVVPLENAPLVPATEPSPTLEDGAASVPGDALLETTDTAESP